MGDIAGDFFPSLSNSLSVGFGDKQSQQVQTFGSYYNDNKLLTASIAILALVVLLKKKGKK